MLWLTWRRRLHFEHDLVGKPFHFSGSGSSASGRLLVLLVVVDLGELRIDDVVLLGGAFAARRTGAARAPGAPFLRLLIHRLAELHRGLRQRVGLGGDRLG